MVHSKVSLTIPDQVRCKLAMMVAWVVAMSKAAYDIEAIWLGRQWFLDGFNKPIKVSGRSV